MAAQHMLANVRNVRMAIRLRWVVRASSLMSIVVCLLERLFVCRDLFQFACLPGRGPAGGRHGPLRGGGARRVLRGANVRRGVAATSLLLMGGAGPSAALPDPARVVEAWLTVRQWVDDFQPPEPDAAEARVPLEGVGGVCVILRSRGRVVGGGVDAAGDDLMLRRAAARALGEVLGDPAVANLPRELAAGAGGSLTVEVEVAGPLIPLLGRSYEAIAAQLSPGLDGVAVRRGDRTAILFPAQMRASNTANRIARLLPPLAAELGLAPLTLPELTRRFEISIYRFRAAHLAQAAPGSAPFPTTGGEILVGERAVTREAILDLAAGIARRLLGAMAPMDEPVGLLGTYRPASDRYDPLLAPPAEQALAAWALARYAGAPGVGRAASQEAGAAAARLLVELAEVDEGEADPLADDVACAAIVHAALAAGVDAADPLLVDAARRVQSAYTEQDGFVSSAGTPLSGHDRALIASALARLAAGGRATRELARGAVDDAWAAVPAHQRVALLPWLAWAERDLGTLAARAAELDELRRLLDASRITPSTGPTRLDLAGGFALTGGDRVAATAQSLRPAVFLAWMTRRPELTPPAEMEESLGRVLRTARFAMQLAVRPETAWAYRNPERAAGGIRAATWDADQPVAAQAMGLAFAVEMLETLRAAAGDP